jgi:manganese transport protein
MGMVFQYFCIRLGIITRMDLAQHCRKSFRPSVCVILYILTEIAIIATDLAEVIGSAIALNLLFGIPLVVGVFITALDVIFILQIWNGSSRWLEYGMMVLVLAVGVCFGLELYYTTPNFSEILKGFIPSSDIFDDNEMLLYALGIIGATVMPHNLYLHSYLAKGKQIEDNSGGELECASDTPLSIPNEKIVLEFDENNKLVYNGESAPLISNEKKNPNGALQMVQDSIPLTPYSIKQTLLYATLDAGIALVLALTINCTILIVGSAAFYKKKPDFKGELPEAYHSLNELVGYGTGAIFAVALLLSGQSSTITGTVAGQVVMQGYLGLTLKPWIRRLITRLLAIIPAIVAILCYGDTGLNKLLIYSQVVLSIQLPFAVIPLLYFTSSSRWMNYHYRNVVNQTINIGSQTKKNFIAKINSLIRRMKPKGYENGPFAMFVGIILVVLLVVLSMFLVYDAMVNEKD